jgi:phospholipase/lecithinase/hemolysin
MQKVFITAMMIGIISIVGCRNNDSQTNSGGAQTAPKVTFIGPNIVSDSVYCVRTQTEVGYLNDALAGVNTFAHLPVPTTQNGNTYTWSHTQDTLTMTLTGVKAADGSFSWTLVLNGIYKGITYTNYKVCDGTTSSDEKIGNWIGYIYPSTIKRVTLDYSTDGGGILTGTYKEYESDGITLKHHFVVINNPITHVAAHIVGSITEYNSGGVIIYYAEWSEDGHGSWSIPGATPDHGSW